MLSEFQISKLYLLVTSGPLVFTILIKFDIEKFHWNAFGYNPTGNGLLTTFFEDV
jgi:hypothetical protein